MKEGLSGGVGEASVQYYGVSLLIRIDLKQVCKLGILY